MRLEKVVKEVAGNVDQASKQHAIAMCSVAPKDISRYAQRVHGECKPKAIALRSASEMMLAIASGAALPLRRGLAIMEVCGRKYAVKSGA